jgi:glycosyltransferase involved in cell wall biosynthesis
VSNLNDSMALAASPGGVGSRRIKVVLLPPEAWRPGHDQYRSGEGPDPTLIFRVLAEEHGVDVEIIDPLFPGWVPFVHRHPIYRGLDPFRALKVLLRRRHVDLVISVFESSASLIGLARRWFRFQPGLLMWDIAPDEKWRVRRGIQDITVPRVDGVLLLSSWQTDYLERHWSAGSKCRAVWQHVDTGFYVPVDACPEGPILAIGDDHGRDWATFVKAIAPLDIDVVVKTKASINLPPDARCRLRQISQRLSFKELRELYARCSLVVIPLSSTLNVSGVGSVLESMAMGKALIISDNPPIRDYVEAGRTAEVVPVGEAEQLREAVLALKEDPERMLEMGARARERAQNLYSKPAFARRLAELVKEFTIELSLK